MANELTTTPVKNVYTEYGDAASARSNIIGLLLRFTKHGAWVAGQDREEVPVGTRMIAHIPGVKIGWVKWSDGMPVENILGLLSEGFQPPQRDTLGDLDESLWGTLGNQAIDPWQFANFCMMYAPDNGELYTFTTGSKGGLGSLGGLISAFGRHYAAKPNELPIVELQAKSYNHRDYGETFVPVFKLVGWTEAPEELINASDTPQDFEDVNEPDDTAAEQAAEAAAEAEEAAQAAMRAKAAEAARAATAKPKQIAVPAKVVTKVMPMPKKPTVVTPAKGKGRNGPSRGVRF